MLVVVGAGASWGQSHDAWHQCLPRTLDAWSRHDLSALTMDTLLYTFLQIIPGGRWSVVWCLPSCNPPLTTQAMLTGFLERTTDEKSDHDSLILKQCWCDALYHYDKRYSGPRWQDSCSLSTRPRKRPNHQHPSSEHGPDNTHTHTPWRHLSTPAVWWPGPSSQSTV